MNWVWFKKIWVKDYNSRFSWVYTLDLVLLPHSLFTIKSTATRRTSLKAKLTEKWLIEPFPKLSSILGGSSLRQNCATTSEARMSSAQLLFHFCCCKYCKFYIPNVIIKGIYWWWVKVYNTASHFGSSSYCIMPLFSLLLYSDPHIKCG